VDRFALPDLREEVRAAIARRFLALATVVFGAAGLLLATTAFPIPSRATLATCFALAALLSLIAMRWRGDAAQWAVFGVNVGALALLAVYAALSGLGVNAPVIGFMMLLSMVSCVVLGVRTGIVTTIVCVAGLIALAWAEHQGWIAGAALLVELPLPRRVANHLLLVVAGLGCGLMMAHLLRIHRRASDEREARFVGLLGIAVDTYWEIDAAFHSMVVWRRDRQGHFVKLDQRFPAPWDLPEWTTDAAQFEAHKADLAARKPFRDLHTQWRRPEGGLRHELISGEPRLDAQGRFMGYWGVGRNITADVLLEQSARASEARYRNLFDVSPLALVIHQDWQVIDANAAAVALFGYADVDQMKGERLLQHLGAEEQAISQERLRAVQAGQSLRPAVYRWHMRDGRRPILRATATRLESEGQAAVLAIFDDITELHDAQDALRRSETTLSHLVATSPDLITLTDLETGHYVMVNQTFTRLTGYSREQAVGHTALELGVWVDAQQRMAFVDAVRSRGTIADWPQEFVSRSGERFSLLLSAAQFELEGRRYLVLNGRDISESERTRLAHEAVLQNASLGIAFTRNLVFVQANPALEQMLGWERGTLVGQHGRLVWSDEADYLEVGALVNPRLKRGEPVEFVRQLRRRDGTLFWGRMMAKVVDPSHPLRGGTIWIVEDITERRRTEQALAKARDDAEAASRAKSAFLANTSHEIRTPLNGLVGLARLARRPEVDETRRRQYLDQIGDSAETLTAVISDVLDLSKIEAGKLLIDHVPFDLGSLFDSLGRVYGTLADARGLCYEQTIDPALPRRATGDPVRLRQVLTNYLNNALKFTQRGRIALGASVPREGWLRVEVSDTGPGIDAGTQTLLFNPFVQADQSTTRRFGGTGLGLSICRELASLMQGSVGVRSVVGQGSRFWIELPLDGAAAFDPETGFGEEEDGDSLAGARVLMAEDNAVNMTIAVAMLEQWGVIVSQAGDGAQALEAVAQAQRAGHPFDVVLMDVQMPVMSGYEATRLLRERHDAQTLPIIALTAAALTSERELALAAGMNDFLTKPIDAQRLHDTLGATLDARRAAREAPQVLT